MRRNRSPMAPWAAAFVLILTVAMPGLGQNASGKGNAKEKKEEDRTTSLKIHVVGGARKEPVNNASVYLKFQEAGALHFLLHHKKKVELDLKTDLRGYASFPELPQGKLLIQIVAPGWQTFGEYYKLDKDFQTIEITLHRPKTRWY